MSEMTIELARKLKAPFIPTSAETRAYADAEDIARPVARNELIRTRLAAAAYWAADHRALCEVIAASLLIDLED